MGLVSNEVSKTSPFIYYPDMSFQLHKQKDCTAASVKTLCRNGMFTQVHEVIINALYKYEYLNAYLIRKAVQFDSKGNVVLEAAACRKILKSLVKQGMILQYTYKHTDEEGKEQASPYVYKLSAGGLRFVSREKGLIAKGLLQLRNLGEPFSIVDSIKTLVENQFHIFFMKQYGDKPYIHHVGYRSMKYKGTIFPGVYQVKLGVSKAVMTLFTFAIRLNEEWDKEYLNMLRDVNSFMNKNNLSGVGCLVLCETEYQAMLAQRKKATVEELKELEVFYICDNTMIESDDILSQLIEVLPEDNYSTRRILSLQLDTEPQNYDLRGEISTSEQSQSNHETKGDIGELSSMGGKLEGTRDVSFKEKEHVVNKESDRKSIEDPNQSQEDDTEEAAYLMSLVVDAAEDIEHLDISTVENPYDKMTFEPVDDVLIHDFMNM